MLVFKHPKYYEEMRRRARAYQKELKASQVEKAISPKQSTDRGGRAPADISTKPQAKATSLKPERQASSKASSIKPAERQASSD